MGGGNGLFWILFLVLPAVVGGIVGMAKPPEMVAWINKTSRWWHDHYIAVKARDGLISGLWAWLIWGVHKLHGWTESIEDEAVRAGTRFGLFFCVAGISVIVIASLLYLAFVLAVIALGIWILSAVFGDGSGKRRDWDEEDRLDRSPRAAREGRSVRRTDWLGNPYTEHLDKDGRRVGRSEVKKDWLGNAYVETRNADGDVVETSRRKKDWLGNDYVEHRDADGDRSGESRNGRDWLGNDYVEHRDSEGNERGRSRKRQDWLGNDYTEHEPRG